MYLRSLKDLVKYIYNSEDFKDVTININTSNILNLIIQNKINNCILYYKYDTNTIKILQTVDTNKTLSLLNNNDIILGYKIENKSILYKESIKHFKRIKNKNNNKNNNIYYNNIDDLTYNMKKLIINSSYGLYYNDYLYVDTSYTKLK